MHLLLKALIFLGLGSALAQTANTPNDPLYKEQIGWSQLLGAEEITKAAIPKQGLSVVGLAYHDFPVDCTHPDIFPNIDFTYSKNFVGGDVCDPFSPHGTAMLGVASKSNNGIGIIGVWDGPVALLSTSRRDARDIPSALPGEYDIQMFLSTLKMPQKIVVLNSSVAFFNWTDSTEPGRLRKVLESIQDKTLVVFACGNSPSWRRDPNLDKWSQKDLEMIGCSYSDLPNVIGVSSLEPDGSMAPFDYYGKPVTFGSLGENILTACPLDLCGESWPTPGYFRQAGTSMSARDVAALIAKVLALFTAEHPEVQLTATLAKRAAVEGSCFEPKLLSHDPRYFGNPIRFCADGMFRWLRRYAENKLKEAESPLITVSGTSFISGGWVEIYGSGFAEEEAEIPSFARIGYSMWPGHVRIWCNGVEAGVGFVSPTQVNTLLPGACYQGEGDKVLNRLAVARSNKFGEILPLKVVKAAEGFSLALLK